MLSLDESERNVKSDSEGKVEQDDWRVEKSEKDADAMPRPTGQQDADYGRCQHAPDGNRHRSAENWSPDARWRRGLRGHRMLGRAFYERPADAVSGQVSLAA